MSKKSFLILAAGAVAGWAAAKRLSSENDGWATSSDERYDKDSTKPTPIWGSRPETPPASRPVTTAGDPFRGAFAGAMAEVESHLKESEDPETEVA